MQPCYFLSSACHTSLGADIDTQLAALSAASPAAPQSVVAHYAQQRQTLPYKLLSDTPLENTEQRLYRVLEQVVGTTLDAAELTRAERAAAGLFFGTSSFDISVSEAEYRGALQHSPTNAIALATLSSQGGLAAYLRERFELRGPDYSFNTACTASANALIYADAMIRSGQLQHALVVGVELYNSLTALGFHGLQLLTSTGMKPFDRERNGLILGEGCSALLLSSRKARPHAFQLSGSANLCDTYGMSAANPDGSTVAVAITQALQRARLQPSQIDAIKVHGTASLLNDEAEATGMRRVFAAMPPLVALKPFIGHTLGACGLNELLLFCAAAQREWLPATPGIGADSEVLGVSLNQAARALSPGRFMLNYFGFGGNNTSLIVSNLDE